MPEAICFYISGMLCIVGERESAHAKLEAHITLWYVHRPSHIYKKIGLLTRLEGLTSLANYKIYIVYRDFITTLIIGVLNFTIIQNLTFNGAFISQI